MDYEFEPNELNELMMNVLRNNGEITKWIIDGEGSTE